VNKFESSFVEKSIINKNLKKAKMVQKLKKKRLFTKLKARISTNPSPRENGLKISGPELKIICRSNMIFRIVGKN